MADAFVVRKLTDWGLEKYVDEFKEKQIGQLAFCLLQDDNIAELIPGYGDQVVFKHHFKKLPQANDNIIFDKSVTVLNTSDLGLLNGNANGSSILQDNNFNVLTDNTHNSNSVVLASLPLEFESNLSNPSPSTSTGSSQVNVDQLRKIVKQSGFGKALLDLKRSLRLKERRRLSDFIINYHLRSDPLQRIYPSEFVVWAEHLSIIFPKDGKHLWYSPRGKTGNETIHAHGPLLAAYYAARREYSDMHDECLSDEDEDGDNVAPEPDDTVADIQWLSSYLEPWTTVQEKWQSTAEARMRVRSGKRFNVTDYLEQFKVLRQPTGHLLIQADFQSMYEEKATNLFNNIDTFILKVFNELKTVRPCSKELKATLKKQELALKTSGKLSTNVILMHLCHLVPVATVSKKKQKGVLEEVKGWRPSRQEVQNGFMTHIEHVSKLQETINRRDRKFFDIKQTKQPFVIVVGENLDSISASYVCINDFYYLLNTPLEALDVCFKAVFALSAKYSIESRPLWMLLQTFVYGMFTPHDKLSATPSTVSLLARFNISLQC